jgi:hypothetical protein
MIVRDRSLAPPVHDWSGCAWRTRRNSALICSHIGELISSRTCRAFSRAAVTQAASEAAPSGASTGSASRRQMSAAVTSDAAARPRRRSAATSRSRAVCSARSRYRLVQ